MLRRTHTQPTTADLRLHVERVLRELDEPELLALHFTLSSRCPAPPSPNLDRCALCRRTPHLVRTRLQLLTLLPSSDPLHLDPRALRDLAHAQIRRGLSSADLPCAIPLLHDLPRSWRVLDVPSGGGGWIAQVDRPNPPAPRRSVRFTLHPDDTDPRVGPYPYFGTLHRGSLHVIPPPRKRPPSPRTSATPDPPPWRRGTLVLEAARPLDEETATHDEGEPLS